jgi:hypothetical protein
MTKVLFKARQDRAPRMHGVGADHQQRAEFAFPAASKHLRQRLAGRGGQARIFRECARSGDRHIAGQQVGEEAHVGRAARVGVVAEIREANVGPRFRPQA